MKHKKISKNSDELLKKLQNDCLYRYKFTFLHQKDETKFLMAVKTLTLIIFNPEFINRK